MHTGANRAGGGEEDEEEEESGLIGFLQLRLSHGRRRRDWSANTEAVSRRKWELRFAVLSSTVSPRMSCLSHSLALLPSQQQGTRSEDEPHGKGRATKERTPLAHSLCIAWPWHDGMASLRGCLVPVACQIARMARCVVHQPHK